MAIILLWIGFSFYRLGVAFVGFGDLYYCSLAVNHLRTDGGGACAYLNRSTTTLLLNVRERPRERARERERKKSCLSMRSHLLLLFASSQSYSCEAFQKPHSKTANV